MTDTTPTAERWSTDAERAAWKQEAEAQIAQSVYAMLAAYNAHAAQRREQTGQDYWDRRMERAPLVAAVPHNGRFAGI